MATPAMTKQRAVEIPDDESLYEVTNGVRIETSEAALIPDPPRAPVPEDESLYEVINGLRVEQDGMGSYECVIATFLASEIMQSLGKPRSGIAIVEMLFRLVEDPQLDRRPDVAYVSYERWPQKQVPKAEAWSIAPNLAIEVVSETNRASAVEKKIHEYFDHGVEQVWVIYPETRTVYVHDSKSTARILDESATLDGGKILPNFKLSVRELFEIE